MARCPGSADADEAFNLSRDTGGRSVQVDFLFHRASSPHTTVLDVDVEHVLDPLHPVHGGGGTDREAFVRDGWAGDAAGAVHDRTSRRMNETAVSVKRPGDPEPDDRPNGATHVRVNGATDGC